MSFSTGQTFPFKTRSAIPRGADTYFPEGAGGLTFTDIQKIYWGTPRWRFQASGLSMETTNNPGGCVIGENISGVDVLLTPPDTANQIDLIKDENRVWSKPLTDAYFAGAITGPDVSSYASAFEVTQPEAIYYGNPGQENEVFPVASLMLFCDFVNISPDTVKLRRDPALGYFPSFRFDVGRFSTYADPLASGGWLTGGVLQWVIGTTTRNIPLYYNVPTGGSGTASIIGATLTADGVWPVSTPPPLST